MADETTRDLPQMVDAHGRTVEQTFDIVNDLVLQIKSLNNRLSAVEETRHKKVLSSTCDNCKCDVTQCKRECVYWSKEDIAKFFKYTNRT